MSNRLAINRITRGECEEILAKKYNIPLGEIFYMCNFVEDLLLSEKRKASNGGISQELHAVYKHVSFKRLHRYYFIDSIRKIKFFINRTHEHYNNGIITSCSYKILDLIDLYVTRSYYPPNYSEISKNRKKYMRELMIMGKIYDYRDNSQHRKIKSAHSMIDIV